MHFVKHFNINGVDTKQVACIELKGKPNAATEGAVGVLGMDMLSPTHEVYKCVGVNGSVYTWELLSAGMSIVSATVTKEGAISTSFLYTDLLIPNGYLIKVGDLILDSEGYLYKIDSILADSCTASYSGTHIGGGASGGKDYRLTVTKGKLQLVTENGNVVSETNYLLSDEDTIYRDPTTGEICAIGIKTVNGTVLRFFVGEQSVYDTLTDAQKQGLFAIITNDKTREDILTAINELQSSHDALRESHDALRESLAGGSFVVKKANDADNFGGNPLSNFRGNNTGFIYPVFHALDASQIWWECHVFVMNASGLPTECYHGFLDVDYFNGDSFIPHEGQPNLNCVKQTFRNYEDNRIYVRTGTKHANQADWSWSLWLELTADASANVNSHLYLTYLVLRGNKSDNLGVTIYVNYISRNNIGSWDYSRFKADFIDNVPYGAPVVVSGWVNTTEGHRDIHSITHNREDLIAHLSIGSFNFSTTYTITSVAGYQQFLK